MVYLSALVFTCTAFLLNHNISDIDDLGSIEFKSLQGLVSEKTLNAVADMGFTTMMEIQHKSIVPLLKGRYSPCVLLQLLVNI